MFYLSVENRQVSLPFHAAGAKISETRDSTRPGKCFAQFTWKNVTEEDGVQTVRLIADVTVRF